MFEGFSDHFDQEARLVILRAICGQTDYRMNDSMIEAELKFYAINRGREYIRNQLCWLRDTAGAVKLVEAGGTIIAEALEPGVAHVNRQRVLEGVKRPSPARSV